MFKAKESAVSNIAFVAIMCAIDVIVISIATLFPISAVFIILLLPFLSTSVYLTCKNYYYFIYAISSVGVCMGATFYNNEMTLFYLIPSIVTGFIFGLFIKKNINPLLSVILSSIIQCLISIGIIYLLNFIYKVDFINQMISLFKLDKKENIHVIVLSFFFLVSLIQEILSYLILNNEIKKIYKINENYNENIVVYIGIITSILVIPFIFFAINISYLLMFISILLSSFILIVNINKKRITNSIIYIVMFIMGFILFVFLFNNIKMPYSLLLINISNILIFTYTFIYNLIVKDKKDVRLS